MASEHHGVVYTRRWVVDLVLDIAGYAPGKGITGKVIVEPACGEGAFLVAIAERLAKELTSVHGDWDALRNAVRAYDIDADSLEVARTVTSSALVSAGCPEGQARDLVDTWLVHGDFILDDVTRCDFVVGNPPYVRATEIDKDKRSEYVSRLRSVTAGCDLYVSFFDRGLDILRDDGVLCFICADRWLQNKYGALLRARMGDDCDLVSLVRMHGVDAFDDAVDAYPAITTIRKGHVSAKLRFANCKPDFGPADADMLLDWLRGSGTALSAAHVEAFEIDKPTGTSIYPIGDHELVDFVSRASKALPSLEQAGVHLGIGVATGCDDVFLTQDAHLVESDRMMPLFYMRDYRKGNPERRRWLVNPWNADGTLVDLEEYPRLKTYFMGNKARLSNRHVAKKNEASWYRTIDKVNPDLMDRDLLLMPDMTAYPAPVLSHGLYPHHNCYWLTSDEWDMRALGGLLMADTTRRFIDAFGVKMRGGTLRFQAQYLRLVHMPQYAKVSEENRAGLARAFMNNDRAMATHFAIAAYEENMG